MNPEKKRIRPQKPKTSGQAQGAGNLFGLPGYPGRSSDRRLADSERGSRSLYPPAGSLRCPADGRNKNLLRRDFQGFSANGRRRSCVGRCGVRRRTQLSDLSGPADGGERDGSGEEKERGNLFWKAADWRSSQPSSTPILSCNWIDSLIIFPSLETEIKKQPEISCCRKFQAVSRQAS